MSVPSHVVLADPATVDRLAWAMPPQYRLLVQLLANTALRWCEAAALQRKHCHWEAWALAVEQQLVEDRVGWRLRPLRQIHGWVRLGRDLGEALVEHLDRYVEPGRSAFLFTDAEGEPLRAKAFERDHWHPALKAAGLGDFSWGIDTLQTARLWSWIRDTQPERRKLASGIGGDASGWRRP